MISAGDFKNGVTLEIEGNVCQIVEFQHVNLERVLLLSEQNIKTLLQGLFWRNPSVLQRNSHRLVLTVWI